MYVLDATNIPKFTGKLEIVLKYYALTVFRWHWMIRI